MGRFRRNNDDNENKEKPSSRRFGRRSGDDDKKDEKKSSSRFGRFGGGGGGSDDKKDDSSSSGRRFGSSGSSGGSSSDSGGGRTFGRSRGGDDDKGDDGGRRTPFGSSSQSSSGGSSPFNRGGDSGGSSGSGRTFGSRGDDKKDDKKSGSSRFGRSGGDDKKSGSSSFGSRGGDDKKTGSSRFGRSSGGDSGGSSGGGSRFGSRGGDDDKKSGSSSFGRSSGGDDKKTGSSRFGRSGGTSTSGRFGDDKKDDKTSPSSRFGSSRGSDSSGGSRFGSSGGDDKKTGSSRFGRSGGTSTSGRFGDDKKDDKTSPSSRFGASRGSDSPSDTSGGRTFGSRSGSTGDTSGGRTFGASRGGDDKKSTPSSRFGRGGDDKKDDKSSTSSRFGASRGGDDKKSSTSSRFGRGGDDKKDDKSSSGGRFGRGGDDKKDDKSSGGGRFGRGGDSKKDDKSSGGRFGRGKSDDKKSDKPASATGRFGRGQSDNKKSDGGGGLFGRFRRGGDDKKASRAKATSSQRELPKQKGTARNVTTGLDLDRKLDIAGFMMLAVGVFLTLGWLQAMTSSADVQGITGTVDKIMSQLFGDGRIVVGATLIYIGGWLILRYFGTMFDIDYYRLAGRGLMFIALLATLQWWNLLFLEFPGKINEVPDLASLHRQSDQLWQDGGGGGVVGHELYMLLMNFNDYGVVVILIFMWILSLYLGFELSLERTSNYVIATRNARAAKRAERAAQQPEPAEEKPVQQPTSQPALATATAGGGSAKVEDKPQRRGLFGRGGRTEAPSNAPITSETDGDAPKRAIAEEKQTAGRIQAPSNAPITADTDGDTPKRRGLFGRGGRKEAPQPVAENTATATRATAKVAEDKAQPQRRGLFGRGGRDQSTGQVETVTPATASTDGQRAPKEADAEDTGIRPQGRRRFGGAETTATPTDAVAAGTPTPATTTTSTPPTEDTPARRSTAASTETEAPAGRRQAPPPAPAASQATPAKADEGGRATDLQPGFAPPTSAPAQPTPARAETAQPVATDDAKDKADVVTSAVTGASVAASQAVDKPATEKASSAEKPAQPRGFTRPDADKPAASTEDTPKPATPVVPEPAVKEEAAETLVDEQPAATAKPRGLFRRDDTSDKPAERDVTPVPKPAAQQPTDAVAKETVDAPEEAVAMPAASANKPDGLSASAFAAVNAATAPTAAMVADANKENGKSKAEQAEEELEEAKAEATSGRWRHPDFLKLLEEGSEQKIEQQILLQRAQTIEDTLISFGAPGKVVEVNTGPVITQFGVEPDYIERRNGSKSRVKVSAIAGLEKDIALALAAKAIRIEAPVPGKGYVGIEVPNAEASVVSLRDVMMSEHHKKKVKKSKLAIGLGRKVDGEPVTADLTSMPHLLIAGATGSGKSVCVNAIIACLLLQNTPEELQFIMVDPKRVELAGYNGIPHLVSPVVVDLERIVGVLKWVQREMDDRYRRFANVGARNIIDYNENKLPTDTDKLPYLVVIVDELADLMMLAPDETERLIARLAQMARATGIHLIISTQRPSVDVVTGLIKANFPARIAFAVASSVDSRVIIDQPGAEKLLGRGDMLFQAPDAPAPTRMQGAYLSDAEINRITHYWKSVQAIKEKNGSARKPGTLVTEGQNIPQVQSRGERFRRDGNGGRGGSGNPQQDFWDSQPTTAGSTPPRRHSGNGDGEDDLFEQAVELVRQQNRASIAMLQRNFRIGHDRATRLMQILEEKGIVKSEADANAVREVLPPKAE